MWCSPCQQKKNCADKTCVCFFSNSSWIFSKKQWHLQDLNTSVCIVSDLGVPPKPSKAHFRHFRWSPQLLTKARAKSACRSFPFFMTTAFASARDQNVFVVFGSVDDKLDNIRYGELEKTWKNLRFIVDGYLMVTSWLPHVMLAGKSTELTWANHEVTMAFLPWNSWKFRVSLQQTQRLKHLQGWKEEESASIPSWNHQNRQLISY